MQTRGGWSLFEEAPGSREEGGLVSKLVWRVKLVAELEPGVTTETEVARLERGEEAGLADLGLRLNEAKQLTAALQAEMVSAQVAAVGERCRSCAACGRGLASKGYYRATFRSLFGDVPVRVRRLLVCPCHGPGAPKSFAALDLGAGPAPELAYVTAKFAALAPSARSGPFCPSCCRSAGRRTPARSGTGRCGSARTSCALPRMRSSPQRRRPAPSWLGLMAARCAAGTGRSAASRWSQARSSTPGVRSTASPSPATVRRLRPRRSGRRLPRPGCRRTRPRRCCATAMPGCGGCSARGCRVPRSCWMVARGRALRARAAGGPRPRRG